MKLLIINYMALPVPPVKGGAVEYLIDTLLLDNEKHHKYDITLYSIYDEEAEKQSKNYKHTTFKYIKLTSLTDKIERGVRHLINRTRLFSVGNAYISKIVKREKDADKYDAVIIHNAPDFVLRLPESYDGKIILHLHNDYLNSKTKNAKKILDRCSAVYTISDSLGEYVKTIYDTPKVKTLYNGVNLDRFSPDDEIRNSIRKKYNIKDDEILFMYSGRISEDKGVLELVKAFKKLDNNKCKLIIVGGIGYSNWSVNEYLKKIYDIADDRIIFTGYVNYNDMPDLYKAADIGVIPSICNDAFNLTTIEFCANSVPLIISDRGAMKELVNEKCAVIVECNKNFSDNILNALIYMSNNKNLKSMGLEGMEICHKYSLNNFCDRFNELMEDFKIKYGKS